MIATTAQQDQADDRQPGGELAVDHVVAVDRLGEQPRQRALGALAVDRIEGEGEAEQRRDDRRRTSRRAGSWISSEPSGEQGQEDRRRRRSPAAPRRGSGRRRSRAGSPRPGRGRCSRTMNRTLSRWSPNSLAAMTRQPARGTRGLRGRRASRRRRPRPEPSRRSVGPPALPRSGRSTSVSPRRARAGRPLDRASGRCRRATARSAGAPSGGGPCSTAAHQDVLADAALERRRAGRGPATSPSPVARRARPTRPMRAPRSVVPARSTSAGVGSSSPTSMIAVPSPNWAASSSTVPSPISRPAAKIPIRSQTDWTWVSRWLESRIARPRSWTSRRSSSRISTTPIGSIDVVGSSRISRSGDLTSASAMPSRWRMPRE